METKPVREARKGGESPKRCYLIAPMQSGASRVAKFLTELGLEVTRAVHGPTSKTVAEELSRHLAEVNFVVAILPSVQSPGVMFELGMAHALSKPALVLCIGEQMPDLSGLLNFRGVEFIRVPDLGHLADVAKDVDRFVRLTASQGTIKEDQPSKPAAPPVEEFEWARERLKALRSTDGVRRWLRFEDLVAEIFRHAGGEVTLTNKRTAVATQFEADLVVWLNDLAFEIGGPIIVECKIYRGGSGSVVRNLESTIKRLDGLIGSTSARLALVVFDHDRPNTLLALHETPRVLAYTAEALIENLGQGTLVADVAKRRRRAAFRTGAGDGGD